MHIGWTWTSKLLCECDSRPDKRDRRIINSQYMTKGTVCGANTTVSSQAEKGQKTTAPSSIIRAQLDRASLPPDTAKKEVRSAEITWSQTTKRHGQRLMLTLTQSLLQTTKKTYCYTTVVSQRGLFKQFYAQTTGVVVWIAVAG